jgi:His Kinase A (phospho-acceptor) domain
MGRDSITLLLTIKDESRAPSVSALNLCRYLIRHGGNNLHPLAFAPHLPLKIITIHWFLHFLNFLTSAASGWNDSLDTQQLLIGILPWPAIGYVHLLIMQELSPALINGRKFFWSIYLGYAITAILSFTDLPFVLISLPAVAMCELLGLSILTRFYISFGEKKMNALTRIYFLLVATILLHSLTWPFVRLDLSQGVLGYSILLFIVIGFASILPALAYESANETKRMELEQLVAERTKQLINQSKFFALGEMAAGVAHEINNPLAILSCRVEQLVGKLDEKSEYEPIVANMKGMIDRISRIIRALKDFSGQDTIEPEARFTMKHQVQVQLCSKNQN